MRCAPRTDSTSYKEGKLTTCCNEQNLSTADWLCAYLPGMASLSESVGCYVPASALPGTNAEPSNEGVAADGGITEATTPSE